MFESIAKWIGEKFKALRKYYNGFEVLELLGLLFGIGMIITVFALGIAAIVASSGGALAVFLAIAGFLAISAVALNNYTNLGRAIGIIFNLLMDKETPTYEKIGTAIGLVVGVGVAIGLVIIGWPIAVPLLAASATVLPWMVGLIGVPLTIASFQGGGRVIGRILDRYAPSLKAEIQFESRDKIVSSDLVTLKVLGEAKQQIHSYLNKDREHLDFWSYYFDNAAGTNRASTYYALLECCTDELQQVVILYTLLASNQGSTLQQMVVEGMHCQDQDQAVAILGEYIHQHATDEDKIFIKGSLIPKLHLFASSGEKVERSNNKYRDLESNFKDLKDDGNRGTMGTTFSIQ